MEQQHLDVFFYNVGDKYEDLAHESVDHILCTKSNFSDATLCNVILGLIDLKISHDTFGADIRLDLVEIANM